MKPSLFDRVRQRLVGKQGTFSVEYTSLALLMALAYLALFSQMGGGSLPN
ncbi:MAG: hypothetical protein JOY81_12380 [Alphaproteobacteria bacterium]|nr:hypothetical protein [Alphaproteobacteria bacterium]